MKRCPTCQRTYASDEFTFCLDDGALLSAPYELRQGERSSRRSDPPPTEVLPVAPTPTVPSAPRESKSPAMTTIAAPPPAAIAAPRGTTVTAPARVSRGTSWKIVFILGPLVLIAGLVGGTLYLLASQCPQITIYCSAGDNLAACVAGGTSPWHKALVSQSSIWRASSGTITKTEFDQMILDTTGLAATEVTVSIEYHTWLCTTTVSKTFTAK